MNKGDKALFIIMLVMLVISLYIWVNEGPATIDDLSVEERIRYEQMIFP